MCQYVCKGAIRPHMCEDDTKCRIMVYTPSLELLRVLFRCTLPLTLFSSFILVGGQSAPTCVKVIQSAQPYVYTPSLSLLRVLFLCTLPLILFLFLYSDSYYFLNAQPYAATCVGGQSAPTSVKVMQNAQPYVYIPSLSLLRVLFLCTLPLILLLFLHSSHFFLSAICHYVCRGGDPPPYVSIH